MDNESEALVQGAIDKLIESGEHTVIMIAHRLSTIRGADKIALVAEGRVLEYGSHEELIQKENGRYKRLNESSKRTSTLASVGMDKSSVMWKGNVSTIKEDEEEEEKDWEKEEAELLEKSFSAKRAQQLASPDVFYLCIGAIGAVMAGGVFPMWGKSMTVILVKR